ncbi:MAG: hypothetical protein GY861_11340 [bacterium]|nr:hypothetical protein [bacterium]
MSKTIQVTFRLSLYQLAHGLEIIQAMEPTYKPVSMNAMAKIIYLDYISKMSIVSNPVPSTKSLNTIKQMRGRSKNTKPQDNDKELLNRIFKEKVESMTKVRPTNIKDIDFSKFEQPLKEVSRSEVKVVTDFSPPTLEDLQQNFQQEEDQDE